jgi:hypothetical protein
MIPHTPTPKSTKDQDILTVVLMVVTLGKRPKLRCLNAKCLEEYLNLRSSK